MTAATLPGSPVATGPQLAPGRAVSRLAVRQLRGGAVVVALICGGMSALVASQYRPIGRRTPFDRSKLERSIAVAVRKRPIDQERIDRMVSGIVRQLESLGETELPSHVVGEMVMKTLKSLDEVAYVRYASVYRDFRETQDFAKFLGEEGLAEAAEDEA